MSTKRRRDTENAQLRAIAYGYNLTHEQLAEAMRITKRTVDSYFYSPDADGYRPMPDRNLRLLQLEMGLAKPEHRKLKRNGG